ncbi:TlpA family protein disulfide reductase [Flavobacterium cerinum]|uniref:Thioredoxin-like fold domain-containing protein n=1 Tax=Flavobacterium cerinum TaxID=2502784 RepID=A0A444H073_9FLAO|nr:thioredoxin-like domain-containing protein [Flavobacterium cerinum]RWW96651.1 hypothetical protein EPI11_13725 [Flavobacterium cerinum]
MSNFHKIGLLLFLIAALTSCKNDDNDYSAYFGGVVTNPKTPYVIFSKDDKVIDTLHLDEQNRFFIKFDSLAPGLYSFKHEPDYQYVYFDKNDSLMVSINTSNFDESIVFSGNGDKKNNFMMDLYLMQEKDRIADYNIYNANFNAFQKNLDSVYSLRQAFYKKEKSEINWSDDFNFYANARLNLNYYAKKECYPYLHKRRTGKEAISKVPANFYDFRKEINFNDPRLTNFSPFVRYFTAMLNNIADTNKHNSTNSEENSLKDNILKLNIADSIFSNKIVKNEVLDNIAFAYMLEDHNITNSQKFLDHFLTLSTDDHKTNDIKKMSDAVRLLKEGQKLPGIKLLDTNNNCFDIQNNIRKETVIFFWTVCAQNHLDLVYKKLDVLKKEHKNINFIAVNVDEDKEWKKMMQLHEFQNAFQLRAGNLQALKDKWVFTKINRTIILNSDGTIKNAFANLMDVKFSDNL